MCGVSIIVALGINFVTSIFYLVLFALAACGMFLHIIMTVLWYTYNQIKGYCCKQRQDVSFKEFNYLGSGGGEILLF
jgi:hypothetical protein